jgi:hypothetical protein
MVANLLDYNYNNFAFVRALPFIVHPKLGPKLDDGIYVKTSTNSRTTIIIKGLGDFGWGR